MRAKVSDRYVSRMSCRVFDHLIRNADLYSSRGQPITISTEDQNRFVKAAALALYQASGVM
jgi:hypothetical protein